MALAVFASLSSHFGDGSHLFISNPANYPACCLTTLESLLVTLNFKWLQFLPLMAGRSGRQHVGEGGPRHAAYSGSPIREKEVGTERFRASQQ